MKGLIFAYPPFVSTPVNSSNRIDLGTQYVWQAYMMA